MPLLDSDLCHGRVIFPALNKQGEDFSFLQKKKKKNKSQTMIRSGTVAEGDPLALPLATTILLIAIH